MGDVWQKRFSNDDLEAFYLNEDVTITFFPGGRIDNKLALK